MPIATDDPVAGCATSHAVGASAVRYANTSTTRPRSRALVHESTAAVRDEIRSNLIGKTHWTTNTRDEVEGSSRVRTKYRVANTACYERALVRRGDVTLWVAPEAITAGEPGQSGTRGGQRKYADVAIETALMLRLIFHLPLRQAEGF